ncbi:MAG: pitrilysin family protein [bacterium]
MNISSLNFNMAVKPKTLQPKEEKPKLIQPSVQEKQTNTISASAPSVIQAIKAQSISAPPAFKEIETFEVPYLNAKGKLYMLNNGQKVVVIPKEGPTAVKTYVKVGSFNEPDKIRGISHYIEHNLFNGSKDLAPGEFVKKVSEMGSSYNASTNFCMTDYYIESPLHGDNDFNSIISMHADMLQNPLFTEQMLTKEKGPVCSEVQMYQDSPYNTAQNTMLKKLFNIKSESPDLIAGTVNSVSNLTRKDVLDYYNKWYTPDNMTTVIVGDVDPNTAIKTAAKCFGDKSSKSIKSMDDYLNKFTKHYEALDTKIDKPIRTDLFSPLVNSTTVGLGFIGPKNNDVKESLKAEALATALTGYDNARLTLMLKAYSTEAASSISTISPNFNDPQVFQLDTLFRSGEEKEGIKSVYEVLEGIKNIPVDNIELQIIKNKLKDNLNVSGEFAMAISDHIGDAMVNRGDLKSYTEKAQMIDKLTAADIQDAAKTYLNLNKVSLVLLHPETDRAKVEQEAKDSTTQQQPINNVSIQQPKATNAAKQVSFAGTKNIVKSENISEFRLNTNAHIAVNDSPSSTRTSINYLIQSESIPNYKPGVPDILTEIFNNGSSHYKKELISDLLDMNNIKVAGSAGSNSIIFGLDCPNENIALGLEAMKEILFSPNLDQKIFDDIKAGLKLKFTSQQKDPMTRAVEAMYGNHPFGNSSRKILENIDSITLDDVKKFYNDITNNAQTRIVATAPFSKTPELKDKLFNGLQNGFPVSKPYHYDNNIKVPDFNSSKVVTVADDRQQAHVVQLFRIKESGNIKDRAALHLMNTILGETSQSRLFMDLREKQLLAYMVKSKYITDGKIGEIALEIKTTTDDPKANNGKPQYDNLEKSLNGFKHHIQKMQNELATDEELKSAKLALKSKIIFGCESSAGKTDLIQGGFNTPYGTQYLSELLKSIDNITAKDIQNAARLYLNQPSVVSVVASKNTLNNEQNYLKTLGDLTNY